MGVPGPPGPRPAGWCMRMSPCDRTSIWAPTVSATLGCHAILACFSYGAAILANRQDSSTGSYKRVIMTGIRQQQTAATTSPPSAHHHPASTLQPAQMTAIDLPATRSHRGGQGFKSPQLHPSFTRPDALSVILASVALERARIFGWPAAFTPVWGMPLRTAHGGVVTWRGSSWPPRPWPSLRSRPERGWTGEYCRVARAAPPLRDSTR